MATIPMGNFSAPSVLPRAQGRGVDTSPLNAAGQGAAAIGRGLNDLAQGIEAYHQRNMQETERLAAAQAYSASVDDEVQNNTIVTDIGRRVATGDLDWRKAVEEYQIRQSEREEPDIPGLDAAATVRFQAVVKQQRDRALTGVQAIVDAGRRSDFKAQFDSGLDSLAKLAGQPGTDVEKVNAQADGFAQIAREAGIDEATIQSKLQNFRDRNWQNQATGRLIGARDDRQALDQLEHDLTDENGFYASRLDTDKRNVLLAQVLGRKDQLDRRAEAAANKSEAEAERALTRFEAQIATGVMAPADTMRDWGGAIAGGTDEQRERFAELLSDENELIEVRKLPPAQQRAYVQGLQAQQQAKGATVGQVANLHRMQGLIEGDLKRLRDSPLEYDANLRGEPIAPLDMQALASGNVDAVRQALQERMVSLTRIRKQYGPDAGNSVLLPQEAATLSTALAGAKSSQAAQLFGVLNTVVGDPAIYQATMQQIAPNSPVRARAGQIYALQRAGGPSSGDITAQSLGAQHGDVAQILLKGEALLDPGKAGEGAKPFPMPPQDQLDRVITSKLRNAYAGRPGDYDTARQAIRAFYAAKSSDEGDVSGALDAKRLKQAVAAVVGEPVEFEGHDVVPPWGMSGADFHDRAEVYIQARLKAAGLQDPGDVYLMNTQGRDDVYFLARGNEALVDRRGLPLVIRIGAKR